MRKTQKKQMIDIVKTLYEAHDIIKKHIKANQIEFVFNLLADCQNTAVLLGENIEKSEGENFITVTYLENYCDELYQVSLALNEQNINANNIVKRLNKLLIDIENSIKLDIKVKYEIVFMPYKASMWDSMESVWKAACDDEDCDAYVFPIPYYDRNKDFSLGQYHYEGLQFPDYVPIVSSYDLEKRKPDVIYIHNPYDGGNLVTSVDPKYYSNELKKYTECLVYIPYYSMSGGLSIRNYAPAYANIDYMVIQSEYYRNSFDEKMPNYKFLPLGSPKFDKVINLCNNPPEMPLEWKIKSQDKRIYFYNTSIGGMLQNTKAFINKLKYVFKCFVGKQDACLLWRPHPLLESTFESMRPEYLNTYKMLKQFFIDKNLGIYDDTPDMDKSIALSDAYIGDAGSSVVSVFGVTGKPIFIFTNQIDNLPNREDFIANASYNIYPFTYPYSDVNYIVANKNHLYYAANHDFKYKHICKISEKAFEYIYAVTLDNKTYLCPYNSTNIGVLNNDVLNKIQLKPTEYQSMLFYAMLKYDKYLILIPNYYHSIVRYNTQNGEIKYFNKDIDVFIQNVNNERRIGGLCIKDNLLYIGSPSDDKLFVMNIDTGKHKVCSIGDKSWNGTMFMSTNQDEILFLPFSGYDILNYSDDQIKKYNCQIDGINCKNPLGEYMCNNRPFSYPAFCGDYIYLSAYWANKCVQINKKTGEICEYIPPFQMPDKPLNGSYYSALRCTFLDKTNENTYLMFSYYDRALYEVNLKENTAKKLDIEFNLDELNQNEFGFGYHTDWLRYTCMESAFNSLEDFLNNDITGNNYNKEQQIKAYKEIANNLDGTCGEKTHKTIMDKIDK